MIQSRKVRRKLFVIVDLVVYSSLGGIQSRYIKGCELCLSDSANQLRRLGCRHNK